MEPPRLKFTQEHKPTTMASEVPLEYKLTQNMSNKTSSVGLEEEDEIARYYER
jgi:hypothetical protein